MSRIPGREPHNPPRVGAIPPSQAHIPWHRPARLVMPWPQALGTIGGGAVFGLAVGFWAISTGYHGFSPLIWSLLTGPLGMLTWLARRPSLPVYLMIMLPGGSILFGLYALLFARTVRRQLWLAIAIAGHVVCGLVAYVKLG